MGGSVEPGTVVATFNGNINYPNNPAGNHVGIFIRGDSNGFYILEQYQSKEGRVLTYRYIKASPITSGDYSDYFSNANHYSVVLVPIQQSANCNCGDACSIK